MKRIDRIINVVQLTQRERRSRATLMGAYLFVKIMVLLLKENKAKIYANGPENITNVQVFSTACFS